MSLWDGIKNIMGVSDDEYEEETFEEEEETEEVAPKRETAPKKEANRFSFDRKSKTVPFNGGDSMKLFLAKPERFEDVTAIADQYCARRTVVLNLEKADRDLSRRIIDFMSGVAYAKGGSLRKAAVNTFVIAPADVDVSGESAISDYDESRMY